MNETIVNFISMIVFNSIYALILFVLGYWATKIFFVKFKKFTDVLVRRNLLTISTTESTEFNSALFTGTCLFVALILGLVCN